ncbi:hypothetical protein DL767_002338 [Monosporascus sp. MG133]|nr:hypothetical protein DL767_002338 [Monosporascus sp. MG133]
MAALGKLTTALLAGSQETTLALAALNFDFSLWKVEAPIQYQALGSVLSEERRSIAESGNHHLTARRLGALFRNKLPRVNNLHNMYGERVSEIAKHATTGDAPRQLKMFAKQLGIDGTAIWAAATSGPEALSVQLLACMIARIWPPPEATSIWAEIVEARKQELTNDKDRVDFTELAAIQANITREQLAEWDASARAWVRTADSVKKKQQVQLRLIVNNLNTPVNDKRATYESVMGAWITAMEVVENLVSGKPQSVYDGAVLVALTAWHLYPDMVIFQDGLKNVNQDDPLIPEGGVLTVGLQASPDQEGGVRWSLPLTRLRYYGPPVMTTKALGPRNSRIYMKELAYIALGCLCRTWPESYDGEGLCWAEGSDVRLSQMCEYYIWLWDWFKKIHDWKRPGGRTPWLSHLVEAARTFLATANDDKKSMSRLIGFGQRHCEDFIGDRLNFDRQTWSMRNLEGFVAMLYPEKRIQYLRAIMAKISKEPPREPGDWIIAYSTLDEFNEPTIALASVFPDSQSRDSRSENSNPPYHYRYRVSYFNNRGKWASADFSGIKGQVDTKTVIEDMTMYCKASLRLSLDQALVLSFSRRSNKARQNQNLLRRWVFPSGRDPTRESMGSEEGDDFESQLSRAREDPLGEEKLEFEFIGGSPQHAGLYRRKPKFASSAPPTGIETLISFKDIRRAFEHCWLDPKTLLGNQHWLPLKVLGTAIETYKEFPDLTISMDVTSVPLEGAKWASSAIQRVPWYETFEMSRSSILSCIAFFETGQLELDPENLNSVMGMSIDDSLYVCGSIVDDPSTFQTNKQVYRALGNIGKPGVSLLIPPAEPWVRERQNDEWDLINHDTYDGRAQNSFLDTSLHLSLTDYRVPYVRSHLGNREWQAYFQEVVVSVYDGRAWVGDIDILKALEVIKIPRKCKHATGSGSSWFQKGPKITSVDSWHELLDRPKNIAVVRSHRNCFGRLATAVLSAQLGMRTIVLPEKPCQKCFGDYSSLQAWMKQNNELCEGTKAADGIILIY